MITSKTILAAALIGALLAGDAARALPALPKAAAAPVTASTTADGSGLVESVRYRGGYRYYGYRRHRGGIGLGIAAGIIGGAIIANEAYRYRRYQGVSARQRCADRFRSFDWDSGTYMGYDGERHICPYLD